MASKYYTFQELRSQIVNCRACPRLVAFREEVPIRKMYQDCNYWRRPVPGFGDESAWLLITGLAPSAHGGNRTGRIFTGDQSGKFLFKALYEAGFASYHPSPQNTHTGKLNHQMLLDLLQAIKENKNQSKKTSFAP